MYSLGLDYVVERRRFLTIRLEQQQSRCILSSLSRCVTRGFFFVRVRVCRLAPQTVAHYIQRGFRGVTINCRHSDKRARLHMPHSIAFVCPTETRLWFRDRTLRVVWLLVPFIRRRERKNERESPQINRFI